MSFGKIHEINDLNIFWPSSTQKCLLPKFDVSYGHRPIRCLNDADFEDMSNSCLIVV